MPERIVSAKTQSVAKRPHLPWRGLLLGLATAIVVIGLLEAYAALHAHSTANALRTLERQAHAASTMPTVCTGHHAKTVVVSIEKRRMWACQNGHVSYTSPVVTGQQKLTADATPIGTYTIYNKQTNLFLDGSDSTGSWHDYVSYWLPFLTNQYGVYGFHDANWRLAASFGFIDPNSNQGSHGCVELPTKTAHWLYDWSAIGTTVIITT